MIHLIADLKIEALAVVYRDGFLDATIEMFKCEINIRLRRFTKLGSSPERLGARR